MHTKSPGFHRAPLLFGWALVCIFVYVFYSARFSVLHGSTLDNLGALPQKLHQFDALSYGADLALATLGIFIFSLAAVSVGAVLLSLFGVEPEPACGLHSFLARLAGAFLAGHLIYGTLFVLIAQAGSFSRLSVSLSLAVGFLAGLQAARRLFLDPLLRNEIRGEKELLDPGYRLLGFLAAAIFVLSLTLSSARLGYDAAYIYFSDPRLTALNGELRFFLNDLFVMSSFQTGIEFGAIALLFGDQAARLFSWVSGAAVIGLSLGLAGHLGTSRESRVVMLAMLMTSTAFTDQLGDGKVDLTSSAVALASIYWMISGRHDRHKLLAGLFAGLAMVSRPHNLFLIPVFAVVYYIVRAPADAGARTLHRRLIDLINTGLWLGLGALVPLAIHLFENWVQFGNPVAMLANLGNISAGRWQWTIDSNTLWLLRLFYPLVVTFVNNIQSAGCITPVVIAFLPAHLPADLRRQFKPSQPLSAVMIAAGVTLLLWILLFFTILEIRYVFFLWILIFMAASELIVTAIHLHGRLFQIASTSLVAILMGFLVFRTAFLALDTYSPLDAAGNPHCAGSKNCDFLQPINDQSGSGERVLTLMAFRYYLRTDLFACSTQLDDYTALRLAAAAGPDAFWIEAYRQGYTYVAYERHYSTLHLYIDLVPAPENTPDWLELEPLAGTSDGNMAAYRIVVHDPPFQPEGRCSFSSGTWDVEYAR